MAAGGYIGVAGVAHAVEKQYVGVDGVARLVNAGFVGIAGVARKCFSYLTEKQWIYTESGQFIVPKTGTYEVELHGGGGSGGACGYSKNWSYGGSISYHAIGTGGGGGGSGEKVTLQLTKGEVIAVTVGVGGEPGNSGTESKFGSYGSCQGGIKGGDGSGSRSGTTSSATAGQAGRSNGSLASYGNNGVANKEVNRFSSKPGGKGGSGGCTFQGYEEYGAGGDGGGWYGNTSTCYEIPATAGKPGLVAVTLMDE